MDWQFILTVSHILGTALGLGGATFAEIFYLKAARDGIIDATESGFLKTTYFVLRLGMIILVFSGFGYLFFYRLTGQTELIYNPKLWAKLTIVAFIIFNALLLQAKKMPLWLGSAVSLTSWYSAFILGSWRSLEASYISIILLYIMAVIIVAAFLEIIKKALRTSRDHNE